MSRVPRARWIRSTLILGLFLAAVASENVEARDKVPLPALEPWGDLKRPFGDSLDVAARRALGPQPAGELAAITLQEFWVLDHSERQMRLTRAVLLVTEALRLKKESKGDSLALYLEALHLAPTHIPAYEGSVQALLAQGATSRAHALAVQAVRLDPEDEALWALLGLAYQQAGDIAKARQASEYALQLGAATNPAMHGFVEMLVAMRLRDGDVARAESLLAATSEPKTPPWLEHYVGAAAARQRTDAAGARAALRRAASDSGAPAIVFIDLGTAEKAFGNLDAAEQAYRRALALAPHEPAANTGLGLVQLARGDVRGAVARFDQRVAADPRDLVACFNLGRALLVLAQAESAVRAADSAYARGERSFTTCIDSKYQTAGAQLGRAQCRWAQHDLDGAVADASAILDSPPHAAAAHIVLARVALTRGNAQEVVTHLGPLDPAGKLDAVGLAMLGKAWLMLEQPEKAAAVLARAHELAPHELSVAINYGVALSGSGQLEPAETLLRTLAQDHPQDPDVLQNWAAVLQRLGRQAEAESILEKVATQRKR